jgi:ABC-2 type transport system permease protein
MLTVRLQWALVLREWRVEASRLAGHATRVAGAAGAVLIFFFVARALRGPASGVLPGERIGYFSFAVIGLALTSYMTQGVNAMASGIRDSQAAGTLELVVLSPARTSVVLVCSSLAAYPPAALALAASLGTGVALGLDLGAANAGLAALSLVLATASFATIGVLVASVVFVTTRGNPMAWAVRTASIVLCGVFYPVSVLPGALETAAQALPLTHALELLRGSLLRGEGLAELWPQAAALAGLTALLLPIALGACAIAVRIARTDGSLRP